MRNPPVISHLTFPIHWDGRAGHTRRVWRSNERDHPISETRASRSSSQTSAYEDRSNASCRIRPVLSVVASDCGGLHRRGAMSDAMRIRDRSDRTSASPRFLEGEGRRQSSAMNARIPRALMERSSYGITFLDAAVRTARRQTGVAFVIAAAKVVEWCETTVGAALTARKR